MASKSSVKSQKGKLTLAYDIYLESSRKARGEEQTKTPVNSINDIVQIHLATNDI